MSNQNVLKNIMNQFESDEEEEKEENSSQNSELVQKHKKSSSLNENSNNNIKDKLSNTNREVIKKVEKQKRKRDEFGYYVNDYDNEDDNSNNENEENSELNENNNIDEDKDPSVKEEDNQNNNSYNKENENSQNEEEENENNSINSEKKVDNDDLYSNVESNEENKNNKSDNDDINYNNDDNSNNEENNDEINNAENNLINNEDKNKNNINKEENKEEKTNNEKNKIEEEINENDKTKEDDLINELYNKSKIENLEQPEVELFRMGSFRPNPIPGSPKFSKNNDEKNNKKEKEEQIPLNNHNLVNFTETIETTIEGDNSGKNSKTPINKPLDPMLTHNKTIISLGKIPIKESLNNNKDIYAKNNNNLIGEKLNLSLEDEEQAEEDFLKREELKRQKNKEVSEMKNKEKEKENENKNINHKKDEEEGKENVTEDEEDENKIDKINIENNKNDNNNKENNNKNNNIIDINKNNEKEKNNINNTKITNNDSEQLKINSISIKLLEQIQSTGNSQGSSVKHSHKNSDNINNDNNININVNNKKIGVHRSIYSKKKIIPDINNNKNNKTNKNSKNKIQEQKKTLYESPSDKNMKINNTNYTNDNYQNSSTYKKNISPFDYHNNSNYSRQTNYKRQKEIESIKQNSKYPNNNDIYTQEKNSAKKMNNNNKIEFKRQTTPLGLTLYERAKDIKNKLDNKYKEEQKDIISKANKKNTNKESYKMVNKRLSKRIENAINKFTKNGKLNIVNMTLCLYEINIITGLIKIKNNVNDINSNNKLDLVELQSMIDSISRDDVKKNIEVELIEQLWFLLNPKLAVNIKGDILSEFLKIFFCSDINTKAKELEDDILQLLDKYKIQKNDENNSSDDDNNEIIELKSPLRNIVYTKERLWTLNQFIKVFDDLKKNLKAYRENDYTKGDVYNNIVKETDKELTFSPDFISEKYFYKYSQFKYNKDNSIIDLINKYKNKNKDKKPKHDFNKVYERFKAEKKMHDETLEKLREIQREKEMKHCTNVPKINKYNPPLSPSSKDPSTEKKGRNFCPDENILETKTERKQPRYKILYDLRNKYKKQDEDERISKRDILDKNCTFKPNISNNDMMNRTFSNFKNAKQPKGYNLYINRNRSFLKQKEKEKKLEEDKKYGRNYDKLQKMKMKIKPLNITGLDKSPSKDKNYYNNTDIKKKTKFNLRYENIEDIIENVYITLDIKIPNGSIKLLKIYNKGDNETIEDIFNFCKIYSLNDEIKKMLIQKALKYKNIFFGRNMIFNNNDNININRSEIKFKEDFDNIPYS